jgi:hypothetical protein
LIVLNHFSPLEMAKEPGRAAFSPAATSPYVDGALLAIRKVSRLIGVHRGLDVVLEIWTSGSISTLTRRP